MRENIYKEIQLVCEPPEKFGRRAARCGQTKIIK